MYNKGYAYNQLGMREKAIKELEQALEKAAESSDDQYTEQSLISFIDKLKVKLAKIFIQLWPCSESPSHPAHLSCCEEE